jgi:uncharacterized membrane protein
VKKPRRGTDRRICLALCLVATLWLSTALAAPLLEAGGHPFGALLARAALSPICHQLPDRSLWIDGAPMALCARCTGLAAGFLLGCLALAAQAQRRAGRLGPPPGRAVLLAAIVPTALEMAIERSGLWAGSAGARAMTGALPGFMVALYSVPAARELPAEIAGEIRRLLRIREKTHAGTC